MSGIEVSGFADFADEHYDMADKLGEVEDELDEPVRDAVERTADAVLRDAVRNAPEDSGELRASGNTEDAPEGRYSKSVVFDADHAAAVEYGSKPHVIEAAPGSALSFTVSERRIGELPGGGAVVSNVDNRITVDKTAHPGTEAQPFLRPALDANESKFRREMERVLDEAFDEEF